MQAKEALFRSLLEGKRQFILPPYHRNYSWQSKLCQELFEAIVHAGNTKKNGSHFLGSIFYHIQDNSMPVTAVSKYWLVDGHQRITSVSLLLLALIRFLQKHPEPGLTDQPRHVLETYVINSDCPDDSRCKLLLSKHDHATFAKLLDGKLIDQVTLEGAYSKRIVENYVYFRSRITAENCRSLLEGINRLTIVDVSLNKGTDNPQQIYRNLNATSLELSPVELLKNDSLLHEPPEGKKTHYGRYWDDIETGFGENHALLPVFIRHYLTVKGRSIQKMEDVYKEYTQFRAPDKGINSAADAVKDLHTYAQYYFRVALLQTQDLPKAVTDMFKEIAKLKTDAYVPFVMAVYGDFKSGRITQDDFIETVGLVKNYLFRRAVCGLPVDNLSEFLVALHGRIQPKAFLESVNAAFQLLEGNERFPNNKEFTESLVKKNIYHFALRNYLLESLENADRKEPVNTQNFTVEHILPQSQTVSPEWQAELGKDWRRIKADCVHTLGNLTLTAYNTELSVRPFSKKKKIKGGFNTSPLFLNESVRETDKWNESAINRRALLLAKKACAVWKRPDLTAEQVARYTKQENVLTMPPPKKLLRLTLV